jgi:hypothetical protein
VINGASKFFEAPSAESTGQNDLDETIIGAKIVFQFLGRFHEELNRRAPLPAAVAATLPRKRERGGTSGPSQVIDESGCLPPTRAGEGLGRVPTLYMLAFTTRRHSTPDPAPYARRSRARRRPRCLTPLPLAGEGRARAPSGGEARGGGPAMQRTLETP